jgi:hypothetical protein
MRSLVAALILCSAGWAHEVSLSWEYATPNACAVDLEHNCLRGFMLILRFPIIDAQNGQQTYLVGDVFIGSACSSGKCSHTFKVPIAWAYGTYPEWHQYAIVPYGFYGARGETYRAEADVPWKMRGTAVVTPASPKNVRAQ